MGGVAQWLIDWGVPFLIASIGITIFIANAKLLSLDELYSLWTVNFSSLPPDGWPWIIAVLGWLAVPAAIGGIAGHVISQRINRSRSLADHRLFKRSPIRQSFKRPLLISRLDTWFMDPTSHFFVDDFVRVFHGNKWKKAQDHWEIAMKDILSTAAFDQYGRFDALARAQSMVRLYMNLRAGAGLLCPVCDARP